MIIIDTNVLIDFTKGDKKISSLLECYFTNQQIAYSVLTKYEFGINARSNELKIVSKLFDNFWVGLPIDSTTISVAVAYHKEFCKSHSNIDAFDYLIAATAKINKAILITNNIKHFPMRDVKKQKPDADLTYWRKDYTKA